jgi:hypothetical protein
MFDPHTILTQVSSNEGREEWLVSRAENKSREVVIQVGIITTLFLFPTLSILTLVVPYFFGYSADNPFPLLLSSPWIMLPALFLSVALVFSVWRAEKEKGDAVLILLPEGIVECEHWHNEKKRRIKAFAYAELEAFTLKIERGDISFRLSPEDQPQSEDDIPDLRLGDLAMEIHSGVPAFDLIHRDGKREKWTVADKYLSHHEKRLTKRIITDYTLYAQRSMPSQVRYEQARSKPPKWP